MRFIIPALALLVVACAPKQAATPDSAATTAPAAATAAVSATPESEAAATPEAPCIEEDVEPVVQPSELLNAPGVEKTEPPCEEVPEGAGEPVRLEPAGPQR